RRGRCAGRDRDRIRPGAGRPIRDRRVLAPAAAANGRRCLPRPDPEVPGCRPGPASRAPRVLPDALGSVCYYATACYCGAECQEDRGEEHMSLPKTVIGSLCALAVATALSACGSSTSHSATTAARPTSSTSQKTSAPAGKTIVVGTICSCSGPQASVFGSIQKVAQAWASSVNASGGINGHAVKMITMDDGQNPAQSLQDAKALVEQDHVIPIVGETSLVDQAWASYVQAKG